MIERFKPFAEYGKIKIQRMRNSVKRHPIRWAIGTAAAIGGTVLAAIEGPKLVDHFFGDHDQVRLEEGEYSVDASPQNYDSGYSEGNESYDNVGPTDE